MPDWSNENKSKKWRKSEWAQNYEFILLIRLQRSVGGGGNVVRIFIILWEGKNMNSRKYAQIGNSSDITWWIGRLSIWIQWVKHNTRRNAKEYTRVFLLRKKPCSKGSFFRCLTLWQSVYLIIVAQRFPWLHQWKRYRGWLMVERRQIEGWFVGR